MPFRILFEYTVIEDGGLGERDAMSSRVLDCVRSAGHREGMELVPVFVPMNAFRGCFVCVAG